MDYTFFMLPLSVIADSQKGSDQDGAFLEYAGRKLYRLHLVGSIAALELNEESGSGYMILDDTFSTMLVHFQRGMFRLLNEIEKGNIVEVLGTIELYNDSVTLSLNNVKKISLERYMYNKIQSIKNAMSLKK